MLGFALCAIFAVPRFAASFPISPDGRLYTVFDEKSKQLDLIDVATGEVRRKLGGLSVEPNAHFSNDGQHLAASNYWGEVKLWDLKTGRTVLSLVDADKHTGAYIPIAFSTDGTMLAVGNLMLEPRLKELSDNPGIVTVWNTRTGQLTYKLRTRRYAWFDSLAFARQDSTVIGAGWEVQTITLKTGAETILFDHSFLSGSFGFSGHFIYRTTSDWIDVWDTNRWKSVLHVNAESDRKPFRDLLVNVTPDGHWMMATRSHEYVVSRVSLRNEVYALSELRELPTGKIRWTIPETEETAISCFSPDSKTLLLMNGQVRDTATGKILRKTNWRDRVILGENGRVIIAHPPRTRIPGI
jgi:WD40 repeat protein